EVDPRRLRTEPLPGEGVQSEVAHQVEQPLSFDLPHQLAIQGGEGVRTLEEGPDAVERRVHMGRHPGVPGPAVVVEQLSQMAHRVLPHGEGGHPTSWASPGEPRRAPESPGGGAGASPVLALGSVASAGRPVTASLPPRRGKLIGAAAPWPDPPTRKGMTVASRRVTSPGLLVDPGT